MVLKIKNITKKFEKFVLGPLNILIDNNITVVIGSTGSGKTTLINLIAGILKPDTGQIILDNIDITNQPIEDRKIGYVFQDPLLFPHLNVYNNILFGLGKKERKLKERITDIEKIIKELGIGHLLYRNINSLSGGERQKVSLARMLVLNPKIILLDEPLSHIDPIGRNKLRRELRSILKKQMVPTLYVTHFEEDIYALADSIVVLENGKIEENGTFEEILINNYNKSISTSQFREKILSIGNYLIGEVINCENDLTKFKVGGTILYAIGNFSSKSQIGVIVKREDILLSREKIITSARNMILVKVVDIIYTLNTVDVFLKSNDLSLVSRITRHAVDDLGIVIGEHIYAIFKASAPYLIREENSLC
ncbi:MAG: ABC transporter ATP-binding protein [Nitrososphaeraceae archaeon]